MFLMLFFYFRKDPCLPLSPCPPKHPQTSLSQELLILLQSLSFWLAVIPPRRLGEGVPAIPNFASEWSWAYTTWFFGSGGGVRAPDHSLSFWLGNGFTHAPRPSVNFGWAGFAATRPCPLSQINKRPGWDTALPCPHPHRLGGEVYPALALVHCRREALAVGRMRLHGREPCEGERSETIVPELPAWSGQAMPSLEWHRQAMPGLAWNGLARRSQAYAWPGLVRPAFALVGLALRCQARPGKAR